MSIGTDLRSNELRGGAVLWFCAAAVGLLAAWCAMQLHRASQVERVTAGNATRVTSDGTSNAALAEAAGSPVPAYGDADSDAERTDRAALATRVEARRLQRVHSFEREPIDREWAAGLELHIRELMTAYGVDTTVPIIECRSLSCRVALASRHTSALPAASRALDDLAGQRSAYVTRAGSVELFIAREVISVSDAGTPSE